ncbi:MAG TPA: hypothetical protein VM492_13555 [Sumerlaeia bacterium]|nr:hypothetical protein [Sumerlaeia bacterium]
MTILRNTPRDARGYFLAAARDRERYAVRVVSRFVMPGGQSGIGEIGFLSATYGQDKPSEPDALGRLYWADKSAPATAGKLQQVFFEAGPASQVAEAVQEHARKIAAKVIEEKGADVRVYPEHKQSKGLFDTEPSVEVGVNEEPPDVKEEAPRAKGVEDMSPARRSGLNEAGEKVWDLLKYAIGVEKAVPTKALAKALKCDESHVGYAISSNAQFFPAKVKAQRGKGYYIAGNLGSRPTKPLVLPPAEFPNQTRVLRRPAPDAPGAPSQVGSPLGCEYKIVVTGPGLSVDLDTSRGIAFGVLRLVTGESAPAA